MPEWICLGPREEELDSALRKGWGGGWGAKGHVKERVRQHMTEDKRQSVEQLSFKGRREKGKGQMTSVCYAGDR